MAGSVNKVILVGNLGKDPDVRRLNSGDQVVNFSVATSETWRDKTLGRAQGAHRVAQCRDLQREPRQGRRAILQEGHEGLSRGPAPDAASGRTSRGTDRYTTEVVLQRFRGELQLLDSRGGGEGRESFPDEERGAAPELRQVLSRRPPPGALHAAAARSRSTTTFRSEGTNCGHARQAADGIGPSACSLFRHARESGRCSSHALRSNRMSAVPIKRNLSFPRMRESRGTAAAVSLDTRVRGYDRSAGCNSVKRLTRI